MTDSKMILELQPALTNVLRPLSDQPLSEFVQELAILELYRRRAISAGKAAELLNMAISEFITYASRQGIAFLDLTSQELNTELDLLQKL